MIRMRVSKIITGIVMFCFVSSFLCAGEALSSLISDNLRPSATNGEKEDGGKFQMLFRSLGSGFFSEPGIKLAHDKAFKVQAQLAFEEGRAAQIGPGKSGQAISDVADDYLSKSGDKSIDKEMLEERLLTVSNFLEQILTPEFAEEVIIAIASIDEKEVTAKDRRFYELAKKTAAIKPPSAMIKEAARVIIGDTRFITFLSGDKALNPSLFSAGNILSNDYRSILTHVGTFPYTGSENIEGGPRTIYTTLARIEGFLYHREGFTTYREVMKAEFLALATGKRVEIPVELSKNIENINSKIEAKYKDSSREASVNRTDEGSVMVKTPFATVEKFQTANDLGVKETFAIMGKSEVHSGVEKGSGEKVTITIAKADTGSIGGHGAAPGIMLEAVGEKWMRAAEKGLIISFFITRVGDDISVTVTHNRGKDDNTIHKLIWDGFVASSVVAKDLGLYGAGQDLLADAFSGNVKGAGPSVAEMEIVEAGAEVVIFGQADKTAPGAFNRGLYEILWGTNTTWRSLGKGESQQIKVGILDFDYNNKAGRHIWMGKGDYDDAKWFLGYPDRYTIDNFMLDDGTEMGAVTAQRLGIIAGEYVGKDDPMFMIRSQSRFPAVGEITLPFLIGDYIVPGWMRGSNRGPFLPVQLPQAKIGIYDGPPLLSMWSFNITNGFLTGFFDLLAANPAINTIQANRTQVALGMLARGFDEMGLRLGPEELEYQKGASLVEDRLKERWDVFESKSDAPKDGGTATAVSSESGVMDKIASQKKAAARAIWGDTLSPVALTLGRSVNYTPSAEVSAIDESKDGKTYPIIINYTTLIQNGPDGIMMLKNLSEQLSLKNIKLVLHYDQDNISVDAARESIAKTFALINRNTGGYSDVSLDMISGVVVGRDAQKVASQVEAAFGAPIYEVIGSAKYVARISKSGKNIKRIIVEAAANKAQLEAISAAIRLGLEIIPVEGNFSQEQLTAMDRLFKADGKDQFVVEAVTMSEDTVRAVQLYRSTVVAEIGA